jgi:DNA-binding transcriptional regulator YiaG
MSDEDIERNARDDRDSDVILPAGKRHVAFIPALPDVAAIRGKLGLSQSAFAAGFGIRLATVRNWEQGRVVPDGPARILLTVIDRDPRAVMAALNAAASRPRTRKSSVRHEK